MMSHALWPALIALFINVLVAGCASAADESRQEGKGPTADGSASGPVGERLIAQPPAGWRQTGAVNTGSLKRAEFVPDEDDEKNWVRRITLESMIEDPLPDPIDFVSLMTTGRDRECGKFESHPTFAGLENGYPTAVYLLICHKDKNTDRSEVTLLKAIQGNSAFYVITRSMRGEPIPEDAEPDIGETEIGGWAVYLRSISLCDAEHASGEHPCPSPPG